MKRKRTSWLMIIGCYLADELWCHDGCCEKVGERDAMSFEVALWTELRRERLIIPNEKVIPKRLVCFIQLHYIRVCNRGFSYWCIAWDRRLCGYSFQIDGIDTSGYCWCTTSVHGGVERWLGDRCWHLGEQSLRCIWPCSSLSC